MRRGCSIPARCFRPCTAAPNSAACTSMAASSLSLTCRGSEWARVDIPKIRDPKDVEEVVRAAIASEQPLEIIGHGSKRLIGQPMATNALLDLSALNAVTAYEPNELIITVQAGAPLADVQ